MVIATLQLLVPTRSAGRVSISRYLVSPPAPHLCLLNGLCDNFLTRLKSARPTVTCCLSILRWACWCRIKRVTKQSSVAKLKGSTLWAQLCGIRARKDSQPAQLQAQGAGFISTGCLRWQWTRNLKNLGCSDSSLDINGIWDLFSIHFSKYFEVILQTSRHGNGEISTLVFSAFKKNFVLFVDHFLSSQTKSFDYFLSNHNVWLITWISHQERLWEKLQSSSKLEPYKYLSYSSEMSHIHKSHT